MKTWLKRYLPAEVFALIGALVGGGIINIIFHNAVSTALGGTWGDNIGYYGTIVFMELRRQKEQHKSISFIVIVKTTRNIILEFSTAEYLDSFFIRPFALYLFPQLLHNLSLGLIVGNILTDITFYIPTIISYELRNKFLKD